MKQLAIFSIFLISLNVYSQNDKFIIKFCPLPLIDDCSFPTIQGGFEMKLSNRLAWYSELGIKYRKSTYEGADTTFLKPYGIKVKSELRYCFAKQRKTNKNANSIVKFDKYIGTNVYYIRDCHNSEIGYFDKKDSTVFFSDDLGVKKDIFGLNLIFGIQKQLVKHLLIDLYVGGGIRFVMMHNIHQEYDTNKDELIQGHDITIDGMKKGLDSLQGFNSLPNLTFGIRFCYSL